MIHAQHYETSTRPSGAPACWITFAAVILTQIGTNMIQGLTALFDDGFFIARGVVLLVSVNVIAQIGFFPAYPIWSAIMILLDILVIFALTARWDEARAAV